MNQSIKRDGFYKIMGIVLLGLVITGFGSAAISRQENPLDLPIIFHLHAFAYLGWFTLFIVQASLIGNNKKALHMKLGQLSVLLVVSMLLTGWVMAQQSFDRGISPIPDITIQQFMALPVFDLFSLLVFYSLAVSKRFDPEFHKRAMLITSIAILDPATARIGFAIDFAPFPLVASLALLAAIIWHDKRVLGRVHVATWLGLLWVFLWVGFVFGFATTQQWTNVANALFG